MRNQTKFNIINSKVLGVLLVGLWTLPQAQAQQYVYHNGEKLLAQCPQHFQCQKVSNFVRQWSQTYSDSHRDVQNCDHNMAERKAREYCQRMSNNAGVRFIQHRVINFDNNRRPFGDRGCNASWQYQCEYRSLAGYRPIGRRY